MHPDLERLIDLQRLTSAIDGTTRTLAGHAQRLAAADAATDAAQRGVDDAKTALEAIHAERRTLDKDLAVVTGRLDRFKDQLMAVKTNREYHAMQTEIATAQEHISAFEGRILETMLQTDTAQAAIAAAQQALAAAQRAGAAERDAIAGEHDALSRELAAAHAERERVAGALPETVRRLFEGIRSKRGLAVVPMVNGHCSECNVRVRPMVLGTVKKNEGIVQCDTCSRIIFYVAPAPATPDAPGSPSL